MSGGLFVFTLVLAAVLGFFFFSDASVTESRKAEIAQISMAGVCVVLVLYALIRYSFLTSFVEIGMIAAGIWIGKLVASMLAEHG